MANKKNGMSLTIFWSEFQKSDSNGNADSFAVYESHTSSQVSE